MSDETRQGITKLRRRRGVIRSSITRLEKRLRELEEISDQPATADHARELAVKLETLNTDFKEYHLQLIDLVEESDEIFEKEQEILDEHDDLISDINIRLKRLTTSTSAAPNAEEAKVSTRRLSHLERTITTVRDAMSDLPTSDGDISLIEQYVAQLTEQKTELSEVHKALLSIDDEDAVRDQLSRHAQLEEILFDCSHLARRLLRAYKPKEPRTSVESDAADTPPGSGVRLPKLSVPNFDGNLLNWRQFWDQFCVSVHNRSNLSNAEKLVYLQHALKDGSARPIIEGLSQSGEEYDEAVECLVARFDRPRLLHQTHVKMILDAPSVRDGTGKELRRLHDVAQQHVRALKALGQEPSAAFITSIIELKLDPTTMFEWQRHTQAQTEVPHYREILEFIDHRAQASEISTPMKRHFKTDSPPFKNLKSSKAVASFAANHEVSSSNICSLCKPEKHPLYSCPRFRSLSHEKRMATIKMNNICMNCLGKGHYVAQCKSIHRCKKCQNPHHSLLHADQSGEQRRSQQSINSPMLPSSETEVSANTATAKFTLVKSASLLMTCQVMMQAPNGSSMKVRALLDSGSSASFVSERVVQSLRLHRTKQRVTVSGIGGTSPGVKIGSVANFKLSPISGKVRSINVTALVVPRVTRDLPTTGIPFDKGWSHLHNLRLADPDFNVPSRVDVLLGVDIFTEVLCNGRRRGPPGTPVAMETTLGWILCGNVKSSISSSPIITACHTSVEICDDVLQRFWKIEEPPSQPASHYTQEERLAIQHFKATHTKSPAGRFVVPLPRSSNGMIIGESRSQAVRRFISLERSLNRKGQFSEFDTVITEYFDLQHAELVPLEDCEKPTDKVFYLPMHAVYKNTSTTTKIRAVFDASAKSATGISLNDTLLKGPTVHPPLIDVLLRFRRHRVAITADVSKMYRAIELAPADKDLHRFVWRSSPSASLLDYRMTRVTFGVCASSFVANMSIKQNAIDHEQDFPLASKVVEEGVYVDDCLTGADDVNGAISLYYQLLTLFDRGGFLLRKWNSSEPLVLQGIDPKLRDSMEVLNISGSEEYAKTLGLEWNTTKDHFRISITSLPSPEVFTKRLLISNVSKIFDVLGWLSPTVIKMKILLQRLWEAQLEWDDAVPSSIRDVWLRWKAETPLLSKCFIPRYFFPKEVNIVDTQLHGFSDASEDAYSAVVYIRGEDTDGKFHVGLVIAKTRVSPIKRLTIPRLELCGAHLLAQLLEHVKTIYQVPIANVHAWTDSTIVLNWLRGSPRRFKVFVGNRVSVISDTIPPRCWHHVDSCNNPADCASRGIYPSEMLNHQLWWNGPGWLIYPESQWPNQPVLPPNEMSIEEKELCLTSSHQVVETILPLNRYSTFFRFQRVTAWVFRFIHNCRSPKGSRSRNPCLSTTELRQAERHWLMISQVDCFAQEFSALRSEHDLPSNSVLKSLNPFLDSEGLIRVGGRISNSQLPYRNIHPVILHGKHTITKLLIRHEHHRLLHAAPSLLSASISLRFHIIGLRRISRSITRDCTTCRRQSGKPLFQLQGQLPPERVVPGVVFEKVGLDYAGPFHIKYGHVRKPTIVKAYVAVFVSLSVKAVHLEIVSDLTTQAFIAALRRFSGRRGHPTLIWSDHGSNFVGANSELKNLFQFMKSRQTEKEITEFCASKKIEWRFIPERSPHFGGLWESAVRSMKIHLKRIMYDVRLTFEEMSTVLCQVEACLNSRPLVPLNSSNEEVVNVLTPGHFIIGKPLIALPDDSLSDQPMSLLRRWHLCQRLVHHFWNRWSKEYVLTLSKYTKWFSHVKNASVGDIVILRDEVLFPTKWPLARVIDVHPGKDNLVRVVTVKTEKGEYKRPITKIVVLVPADKEQ